MTQRERRNAVRSALGKTLSACTACTAERGQLASCVAVPFRGPVNFPRIQLSDRWPCTAPSHAHRMSCCRAADISCGRERFPVPCNECTDDDHVLINFSYITHAADRINVSGVAGCLCSGSCSNASGCPCTSNVASDDRDGQRQRQECGPACSCGPDCGHRATQQGLAVPLQLRKGSKGWSVHAVADILEGAFIVCFVGEQLNSRKAEQRLRAYDRHQEGHALLVVREYLPSGSCMRLNIDGTRIGNVARFLNHSCDGGNLRLEILRSRGDLLPRVALYAAQDIVAGTELTFSYGAPYNGTNGGAEGSAPPPQRCLCNTAACLGFLPRGGR